MKRRVMCDIDKRALLHLLRISVFVSGYMAAFFHVLYHIVLLNIILCSTALHYGLL